MQILKFFNDCQTLEECKKLYRKLAMQFHPDRGGTVEQMKELNLAYEQAVAFFKVHGATEKERHYAACEVPQDFIELINQLLSLNGITVEICGCFVWVSGATYENRKSLKALGLFYASKKKMWYYKPRDYKASHHKEYSMEQIRFNYGSTTVTEKQEARKSLA